MKFKIGDRTKSVWAGDIVSECEFLAYLDNGGMLFYDITFKIFRYVFWQAEDNGKFILNGWKCSSIPSTLTHFK